MSFFQIEEINIVCIYKEKTILQSLDNPHRKIDKILKHATNKVKKAEWTMNENVLSQSTATQPYWGTSRHCQHHGKLWGNWQWIHRTEELSCIASEKTPLFFSLSQSMIQRTYGHNCS